MLMETTVAKASHAFGVLRKPVLMDKNLRLETKCRVYDVCVCWLSSCMVLNVGNPQEGMLGS